MTPLSEPDNRNCTFLSEDLGFILYRGYGLWPEYNELLMVGGLLRGSIKIEFDSRVIFRFQNGIDSSLVRYSNHIFMYKKPIYFMDCFLLLDQPNTFLRESHRSTLINSRFLSERIGILSLEERLRNVDSYEQREFY